MTVTMTKKATIAMWKEKLASQPMWAVRAMLRIHAMQTADERQSQVTSEDNGVGFTGLDAPILSSFCEQYNSRGFLTDKQMAIVFKKMPKYAGQLYNMTHGKTA